MILLAGILLILLVTNWLDSAYLSIAYFFLIIRLIKFPRNLYILKDGLILNGKYYYEKKVKYDQIEQIVRWHSLYGLNSRVNNGFKLEFKVKRNFFQLNMIVIEDKRNLDKIRGILEEQEIQRNE